LAANGVHLLNEGYGIWTEEKITCLQWQDWTHMVKESWSHHWRIISRKVPYSVFC